MRLTENSVIFPLTSGMVTCTASVQMQSFNMNKYDHACLAFQINSALEGLTDSPSLTFECGSASKGDSSDLTFHYRWNAASTINVSGDTLAAWSSAAGLAISSGYAGYCLFVEFDAEDLPTASKTYNWITPTIEVGTCSVGKIEGWAILTNPRYSKNIMPSALV